MTISRSPELQRAKAILGNSTLAAGARERIYWRIVHKPTRVGRGRWRVSVMVFGWLTAASAAYGLGRIVYATLPVLGNEPAAMSAAQQPTGEAMRRRSKGHGRLDTVAAGSVTSAAPVGSASPSTAAMPTVTELSKSGYIANVAAATPAIATPAIATPAIATPAADVATSTRHLPVKTESRTTTRRTEVSPLAPAATPGQSATNVALATSTPAAVPGQLTTDVAPAQESPKPLTDPMGAREDAPGSNGASELSLQVADYKRAVALLNSQPEAALERLYAHRRQWPGSAIAQEVDLRIIQCLLAIGRTDSARAAARSFLLHYPGSARTQEVSRIANANH